MKDNSRKQQWSTGARSGNKKEQNKSVERIIHDEEFGEEDVELVDSEWADFERIFRYIRVLILKLVFWNAILYWNLNSPITIYTWCN